MTLTIAKREATQADIPFIFSSWLNSYRNSIASRHITKTVYFEEHHKRIEVVAARSCVIIAHDKDDPNQIFGWICVEPGNVPIIHYVYVKHPYRKLGIARSLLAEVPCDVYIFTHDSTAARTLKPGGVYNPYLFYKEK